MQAEEKDIVRFRQQSPLRLSLPSANRQIGRSPIPLIMGAAVLSFLDERKLSTKVENVSNIDFGLVNYYRLPYIDKVMSDENA